MGILLFFVSQVRTRAGIRAMVTTGTRVMVTKAMAMVDTAATATMTTLLVTMDMVLDMITVGICTNMLLLVNQQHCSSFIVCSMHTYVIINKQPKELT